MSSDVHFQSPKRTIRFATQFTAEVFLDLCGTMKLFVFGQPTESGVTLFAVVALVARGGWYWNCRVLAEVIETDGTHVRSSA